MYIHFTYMSSTLNVFCMHKLVRLVDFKKKTHISRDHQFKTTLNNCEHLHMMHQDTQWTPKHMYFIKWSKAYKKFSILFILVSKYSKNHTLISQLRYLSSLSSHVLQLFVILCSFLQKTFCARELCSPGCSHILMVLWSLVDK